MLLSLNLFMELKEPYLSSPKTLYGVGARQAVQNLKLSSLVFWHTSWHELSPGVFPAFQGASQAPLPQILLASGFDGYKAAWKLSGLQIFVYEVSDLKKIIQSRHCSAFYLLVSLLFLLQKIYIESSVINNMNMFELSSGILHSFYLYSIISLLD